MREDKEYRNIQKNKDNFIEEQKNTNNAINDLLNENINKKNQEEENKFQESLTYKLNKQMNNINIDKLKGQLDDRLESVTKPFKPETADDRIQKNNLIQEEKLFNKFKENIFKQKTYINRENLICINSSDRDWFNESHEDRYNFQIRFKPERDSIQRVPKEIVMVL